MSNVQQILANLHSHIFNDNVEYLQPIIEFDLSKSFSWIKIGSEILHRALNFNAHKTAEYLSGHYPELLPKMDQIQNLMLLEIAGKSLNTRVVKVILANKIDLDTRESQLRFLDLIARSYIIEKQITKVNPGLKSAEIKKIIKLLLEYELNYFNKQGVALHVDERSLRIRATLKENSNVNKTNVKNQRCFAIFRAQMRKLTEDPLFEDSTVKLAFFRRIFVEIYECLIREIAKMQSKNLPVLQDNLKTISEDKDFKRYKSACDEEVASMKNIVIEGTTICVYNLLEARIDRLVKFSNNPVIINYINSQEFSNVCPRYYHDILRRFDHANFRRELMERGKLAMRNFKSGHHRLPDDCILEIFGYLENSDLRNLINGLSIYF